MKTIGFTAFLTMIIATATAYAERTPLFNGTDLTGWTAVLDYNLTGGYTADEPTWAVVDGAIRTTGTPFGYLRTKRADFTDFTLHVEYRWWRKTPNPNSGLFVRVGGEPISFVTTCLENQLGAGSAGMLIGCGGLAYKVKRGDEIIEPKEVGPQVLLVDRAAESSEKPFGEWNEIEVAVKGGELVNRVNGVEQNHAIGISVATGAIALQSEGGAIEFRNIWIEE